MRNGRTDSTSTASAAESELGLLILVAPLGRESREISVAMGENGQLLFVGRVGRTLVKCGKLGELWRAIDCATAYAFHLEY